MSLSNVGTSNQPNKIGIINKVLKDLKQHIRYQDTVTLLITISVVIIFKEFFILIFTKSFVDHFFKYCETSYSNDLIISALTIYISIKAWELRRKFIAFRFVLIIGILICAYISIRWFSDYFIYTKFEITDFIAYSDSFLLISIVYIAAFIASKFQQRENSKNISPHFFFDQPVGDKTSDKLKYDTYAKAVALRIDNTSRKEEQSRADLNENYSMAIGINGAWGLGKTSFMNLIKDNLKKDDKIIIDFNPWSNHQTNSIVQDFFDHFQSSIRPFHNVLANKLINYSNKLTSISKNPITKSLEIIKTVKNATQTHDSLYKEINGALKGLGKKVIVFIDDIDRLDKSEILSVVKLVRSTANFHNTFFIVAYDKNYVLEAIKEFNSSNYHSFLEKVFQLELNLPYFDKKSLFEELFKKLCECFDEKHHKMIKQELLHGFEYSSFEYLTEWIRTPRDVTRLVNSVSLNLSGLIEEVNFGEFLSLEILRLKYPSVYELIYRSRNEYLEYVNSTYSRIVFTLQRKRNEQTKDSNIAKYLEKNFGEHSVLKSDIPKIVSLLENLFPTIDNSTLQQNSLSIIHPSNFNKYFSYSLWDTNISEVEFTKYRKATTKEFHKKITSWIEKGLESELTEKFNNIIGYDSREDFEKIIQGIFFLGNQDSQKYPSRKISFDTHSLRGKLLYSEGSYATNFYSEKKEYKKFIQKLLTEGSPPYYYEGQFIGKTIKASIEPYFPLTQEELSQIALKYLQNYSNSISSYRINLWWLFNSCITYSKANSWQHLEEAKKVIKDFFYHKDHKGILLSLIEEDRDTERYYLSRTITSVWGDWNSFEIALTEIAKSPFTDEFMEFFKLCNENSFNGSLSFKFHKINIKERRLDKGYYESVENLD